MNDHAAGPVAIAGLSHHTADVKAIEAFRFPDELWARIVYDFALGYRTRLLDRVQMLRSMTPLYLGWLASFVNEVRDLDGPGTEERVERLCEAFEGRKNYLIARWRWPDRFSP